MEFTVCFEILPDAGENVYVAVTSHSATLELPSPSLPVPETSRLIVNDLCLLERALVTPEWSMRDAFRATT